jgi:dTDP-glucose 4,6-dehydratase
MTRCLITGVAGFVGSHVLKYLLDNTDWEIIGLTRMSRAGNLNRLNSILVGYDLPKRLQLVRHDLLDPLDSIHRHIGDVDYIIHIAADSHVDDSIKRPIKVFTNNVISTANMLDYTRNYNSDLKKFLYYSTDEVFGEGRKRDRYVEDSVLNPRNPYSAGKAAGEAAVKAWHTTYGIPTLIMRTMNMFGEMQDPEKMIPKTIKLLSKGECAEIHTVDGKPGSRFYFYVKNSADAILFSLLNNLSGIINVPGTREYSNEDIARLLAEKMGVEFRYKYVEAKTVRPGYDKRYSLNGEKLKSLGWKERYSFNRAIERTIKFSLKNPEWIE